MKEHELKSWPEFFQPIAEGWKTFELRKNDRNYQVGDVLILREWMPPPVNDNRGKYTDRTLIAKIKHIMHGAGSVGTILPLHGLAQGYTILGIEVL